MPYQENEWRTVRADANGVGIGVAGDDTGRVIVKVKLKINDQGIIESARFKTAGCLCLKDASSSLRVWVTGDPVDEVLHIRPHELIGRLNLPPEEKDCVSLLLRAIRAAVADRVMRWGPGSDWWQYCGFGQRWWRYW